MPLGSLPRPPILLGVMRKPAWMASLAGLGAAALVAAGVYGMPLGKLFAAATCGAAFGLLPIGYVVFAAILLYRVTLESGKFDLLKDSIGHITEDARLQALLIAFAFGAFIEGATGFGTPVAVAAAMLVGLGFVPFYAAAICLLANTAGVAFGAIGIPVATLAVTTGLPLERLSAAVARICTPASLFVPAYLILVMYGRKGLRGVLPAVAVCGIAYTVGAVAGFEFRPGAAHRGSGGHSRSDRAGGSAARVEAARQRVGLGVPQGRRPRPGRGGLGAACPTYRPRDRARLGAIRAAGGVRAPVGLQTSPSPIQQGEHRD